MYDLMVKTGDNEIQPFSVVAKEHRKRMNKEGIKKDIELLQGVLKDIEKAEAG